ncbi:MAG: ROK family protein, partial [Candidatus Omnitrophica bacterium]|nr:ROK family protein [Candidatus Omnitrophota bacterium]
KQGNFKPIFGKEYVWETQPKSFTEGKMFQEGIESLLMFSLAYIALTEQEGFDKLKGRAKKIYDNKKASMKDMLQITEDIRNAGIEMKPPSSIGISFPDVIVNNQIVGGTTSKTKKMRDISKNRDRTLDSYWKDFNKTIKPLANIISISMAERFELLEPIPTAITNDGNPGSLWAAVILQKGGILNLALGTSLAGGYVNTDGSITDKIYELSYSSLFVGDQDPTHKHNNYDIDGSSQQFLSQDAVFNLALELGLLNAYPKGAEANTLKYIQLLLDNPVEAMKFRIENDLEYKKDPKAQGAGNFNMDFITSRAREAESETPEGKVVKEDIKKNIFEVIGKNLALIVPEIHRAAIDDEFKDIILFGRVIRGEAGEIIVQTAQGILDKKFGEDTFKIQRASDMKIPGMTKEEMSDMDALAQAVGTVYLGNAERLKESSKGKLASNEMIETSLSSLFTDIQMQDAIRKAIIENSWTFGDPASEVRVKVGADGRAKGDGRLHIHGPLFRKLMEKGYGDIARAILRQEFEHVTGIKDYELKTLATLKLAYEKKNDPERKKELAKALAAAQIYYEMKGYRKLYEYLEENGIDHVKVLGYATKELGQGEELLGSMLIQLAQFMEEYAKNRAYAVAIDLVEGKGYIAESIRVALDEGDFREALKILSEAGAFKELEEHFPEIAILSTKKALEEPTELNFGPSIPVISPGESIIERMLEKKTPSKSLMKSVKRNILDPSENLFVSPNEKALSKEDKSNPVVAIAVDLGGTKIASAAVDSAGRLIGDSYSEIPTEAERGKDKIIENILSQIQNAIEKGKVKLSQINSIAISSPGPLNPKTGVIKNAPNLPGFVELNLKEIIEQRLKELYKRDFPVFIQHDAAAAALGEAVFGVGKEFKDLHFMTISTGIGSGIIRNRKIYYGEDSNHFDIGETGLMEGIDPKREEFNLMDLASGLAMAREAKERVNRGDETRILALADNKVENITAEIVGRAAAEGDKVAVEIVKDAAKYVGLRLVKLIEEYDEKSFILGGGVTKIGDVFIHEIKETIRKQKPEFDTDGIKVAVLGAKAGMLGAVASIPDFLDLGVEKIGITGGSGSIGSQFIKWLLNRRDAYIDVLVRRLDERSRKRISISDSRVTARQASLLDISALEQLVINNDVIFHLAAWSKSGTDVSMEEALLTNCMSTAFLAQLVKKYDKRLVFTSSTAAYRLSEKRMGNLKEDELVLPENVEHFVIKAVEEFRQYAEKAVTEAMIDQDEITLFIQRFLRHNPIPKDVDLYGLTKIIGERLVLWHKDSISFRLADVYGPGDDTGRRIPSIFSSILQSKSQFQLKDDAKQFIYIDDVLKVLEAAVEIKLEDSNEVINIPGPEPIKVVEAAKNIKRLTNSEIEIIAVPSEGKSIAIDGTL